MPEIFQYGFMVRALAAGLMIGTIAPTIGVFLVLRRLSLIADTLAHVALAGVALALLTGIHPVAGALGVALLGAVGVERLRVSGRLYGDAALAIFLSGGLALAVVLIGLSGGFSVDVFSYLFGSITVVQPRDLWVILVLGMVVLGTVALLYKELFAITFDEEAARVQGVPVDSLNLLVTVLVATTVVVAMRVVGVLLTGALLIAVLAALTSVVAGIVLSFYLNIAAGGAIVACAILLFAASAPLVRRP